MTRKRTLSLLPSDWPDAERLLWQSAIQPAKFLQRASPAGTWSVKRQRIVEQAVGQWFAWLEQNGMLDTPELPAERLTEQRVQAFVLALTERVSPWSVAMMIGALKRGYDVLTPGNDLRWLAMICSGLKAEARPSRNRFAHLVTPAQVMGLGFKLMAEALETEQEILPYMSTQARDGLMLAMLICFPTRIKNFASMKIGEHRHFQQDRYVVKFSATEVKVAREQVGEFPVSLTPWIDWYLEVHRRRLIARGPDPTSPWLWVNRGGLPLQDSAIRAQIESRTKDEFGLHLWPHLFRAAAATGFVDIAPEDIAVAAELLGHASVGTTQKHYILARGNVAHRTVQSNFLEARERAKARLKSTEIKSGESQSKLG
jgi:integrase/recombinase XerD